MRLLIIYIVLIPFGMLSQVGLGTETPRGMLDISSSNAGLVIPRVTSIDVITNGNGGDPVDGTVVYDVSRDQTCFLIDGTWICTCDDSGNPDFAVTNPEFSTVSNYLKASNTETNDQFGGSVSISGDGTRIAVGTSGESSNATGVNGNQANNSASRSGAVYIFYKNGATWSQEAYIKASNTEANDSFGALVVLSDDGTRLAVSAPGEDSGSAGINGNQTNNSQVSAGAVYVFRRSGTNWTQEAYIKASNPESPDNFGNYQSLSINSDGSRLVVGAFREDSNATGVNGNQANNSAADAGAAYVFVRSGTTWTQEAYLKASNTNAGDYFGGYVTITGDGTRIAIGANQEASNATGINGNQSNNSSSRAGAVYIFSRSGATWSQEAYVKGSNTRGSNFFGSALSFSYDGSRLAVGAPLEDSPSAGINGSQTQAGGLDDYGAVYIFRRSGTTWAQEAYIKSSNPDLDDEFGITLGLDETGTKMIVGSRGEDSNATGLNGNQANNGASVAGAVYVYTRCGTTWVQESYAKASNTEAGDWIGIVAISADGKTMVTGGIGEDSNATGINGNQANNGASGSGAAYIIE